MKLFVVRHGETDSNISQIIQGHLDIPLNLNGKAQARELALRFRNEKLDYIFSSDLLRASQTAEPLSAITQIPITYRPELKERHFGEWQGRHISEYKMALQKSGKDYQDYKPNNGESFLDLEARIDSFLNFLKLKHINDSVALVSHSGTNRAILRKLLGKSFADIPSIGQANASLTVLEIDVNECVNTYFLNCTAHLVNMDSLALNFTE